MQNFLFDFDGTIADSGDAATLRPKHALRILILKSQRPKRCGIIWGFRLKPLFRN